MAYTVATAPHTPITFKRLRAFFAGIGHAFMVYSERNSRIAEVDRLNAMTDAQLARLGIERDRIGVHVFSDRLWY